MRKVLVPPRPGLLSALGLLHAEVRADFSLTRLVVAHASGLAAVNEGLKTLARRGSAWLKDEGEKGGSFQWFADLRYLGQNFELIMELKGDRLDARALDRLTESFHRRHKDYYGYDMRAQAVEIVNVRLVATGAQRRLSAERVKLAQSDLRHAVLEKRKVWFAGSGYVTTSVYDRDRLPAGCRLSGPAIVEQMDTTTVVPPRAKLRLDQYGYMHMELEAITKKRSASWAAAA